MQQLEQEGIKLVNFRKIGKKESALLEQYFDKEIATLLSPSIVGKRQPFPFLRTRRFMPRGAWRTKRKRKAGDYPM